MDTVDIPCQADLNQVVFKLHLEKKVKQLHFKIINCKKIDEEGKNNEFNNFNKL